MAPRQLAAVDVGDQLPTVVFVSSLDLKVLQSHMGLNLETEESSNMAPKQHHLPTITLDAHGKATTNQQKKVVVLRWHGS